MGTIEVTIHASPHRWGSERIYELVVCGAFKVAYKTLQCTDVVGSGVLHELGQLGKRIADVGTRPVDNVNCTAENLPVPLGLILLPCLHAPALSAGSLAW